MQCSKYSLWRKGLIQLPSQNLWLSAQLETERPEGSSLTCVTVLCPWAWLTYPSLVLVQPRKTRPYITWRLLMGCKESNQTNKILHCYSCFVVCSCFFGSHFNKQCRPRSDCSIWSSLIWVHTVDLTGLQKTTTEDTDDKAENVRCILWHRHYSVHLRNWQK